MPIPAPAPERGFPRACAPPKTIADFRKGNRAAFKGVFCEFNLLCRKLEIFGAELAQRPDMAVLRRQSVEHVFGTLKESGHGSFLMKGLEKARAEFSLRALACSMRRALSVSLKMKALA